MFYLITRSPLKLKDVYMGLLAKRFGVTPRRPRGFITDSLNATFLFPLKPNYFIIKMHCYRTL